VRANVEGDVPTVEGLQFAYALHPLEPGRFPFRRWRWELWHGAAMVAAGWRLSRPDAEHALSRYASSFGHGLFGLRPPEPGSLSAPGGFRPGATVRVESGSVTCVLVPRALADQAGALPLAG
jgi:hypothetical protein